MHPSKTEHHIAIVSNHIITKICWKSEQYKFLWHKKKNLSTIFVYSKRKDEKKKTKREKSIHKRQENTSLPWQRNGKQKDFSIENRVFIKKNKKAKYTTQKKLFDFLSIKLTVDDFIFSHKMKGWIQLSDSTVGNIE